MDLRLCLVFSIACNTSFNLLPQGTAKSVIYFLLPLTYHQQLEDPRDVRFSEAVIEQVLVGFCQISCNRYLFTHADKLLLQAFVHLTNLQLRVNP